MARPDRTTVQQMINEVDAVTKSRFYPNPAPTAGPVAMLLVPDGAMRGEPFAELSPREKLQVLGDYTHWKEYEARGVSHEETGRVFGNVVEGKPRERWLDGTGLSAEAQSRTSILGYSLEQPKQLDQTKDRGGEGR